MSTAKIRALLASSSESSSSESEDDLSSVTASESGDIDFTVTQKNVYNNSLRGKQEADYRTRKTFVRTHPLLGKWNPKIVRLIEASLTKETLAFDSYIIRQGQPVRGLHFLIKGRARLVIEPALHRAQYPRLFREEAKKETEFGRKLEMRNEKCRDSMLTEQIRVRRRLGYAAAEQRLVNKSMELCNIDEGEIIGDLELIMELKTYSYSVICSSNCELFLLDDKSLEKLITNKNQQLPDMLRPIVEHKLQMRAQARAGSNIELIQKVLNKIEERKPKRYIEKPREKEGKELMVAQLAKLYIEDKTPTMVEPYVPDSVYYVTKSKARAERKAARLKAQERSSTKQEVKVSMNVRLERAKKPHRKAKSRRELEKLATPQETQILNNTDNGAGRYLTKAGIDPANIHIIRPHTSVNGTDRTKDQVDNSHPRSKSAPVAKHEELGIQLTEVFSDGEQDFTDIKSNPVNDATIKKIVQDMEEAQTNRNADRTKIIRSMVDKKMRKGHDRDIQRLLRPKSTPVAHVMEDSENEDFEHEFDYETGESALTDLEARLRDFHGKFSEKKPAITGLQRYKIKSPDQVPIPGGTVYVKQRACTTVPTGEGDTGHSHVRRFMIPRHALTVASKSLASSNKNTENSHVSHTQNNYLNKPGAIRRKSARK